MTMLGANTADLAGLSAELRRTGGSIGDCLTNTTSAGATVVDNVTSAAEQALRQVQGHMEALRTAVQASHSRAQSAHWTGQNQAAFLAGYESFNASMQNAQATTTETFEQFRASITQMSQSLSDYVASFGNAMADAGASVESMAAAVEAQAQSLDATMNTGLSVG